MKKFFVLTFVTVFSISLYAQDATLKDIQSSAQKDINPVNDTTFKQGWRKGALIGITLTQISNSNWVAANGDAFSLSVSGTVNAFAVEKWGNHSWSNTLTVNYGIVNTTTLGVRKVNDLLDYLTQYNYKPEKWKKVSFSLLGELRSQVTSGYDYNYFNTGFKRRISGFFAPAYITVSPGISWQPNSWFSLFGSPAAIRWTIVSNGPYSYDSLGGEFYGNKETALATLYGVDPTKQILTQFGAFVSMNIKKEIAKNVVYIGVLQLYSNYLSSPKDVALFSTNQIQMKVNKWLNVNYEIDFLDDNNIKQATAPTNAVGLQVLSTLGVGLSAKF